MKALAVLSVLTMASIAFCASDKTNKPDFAATALVIDCFCVQNRSARAPAGYYSSPSAKAQLQRILKGADDDTPIFELASDRIAKIRAIALSQENRVEAGKVNFFIRFFNEQGESESHALTREKIKEVIDTLPEERRAGLINMYQHG
jgi:hypothetical protein